MARTFASASSQLLRANSAGVTAPPVTISAWAKTTVTTGIFAIASAGQSANADFMSLEMQAGGIRVSQNANGGTARNLSSVANYPTNAWFHAAGTAANYTDRAVWLQGVKATASLVTGGSSAWNVTGIGVLVSAGAASRHFDGSLAEVAMWDVVLSDDEIIALSLGYSPLLIRPQNLVAYYPGIGEAASGTCFDKWRNRLDLTVTPSAGTTQDHPPILRRTRAKTPPVVTLFPPDVPNTPSPADGATLILAPVTLSWTAIRATSYDVYFGTSALPPLVSANQPGATYAVPTLVPGQTYYWQIDAKNAVGNALGPVWSFTAYPAPAVPNTPSPADGATNVIPSALTWVAAGATSYTVRFGTSPTPPVVSASQPGASYAPGGLTTDGQTYYWQIEAHNVGGSTLGPVWSFTTPLPDAPSDPSPTDGSDAAPVELAWTANGAALVDVHFGTSATPPLVSANQAASTYTLTPGTLVDGTVYYWQIVAKATTDVPGPVWSFTARKPHTPILPAPPNGSTNQSVAPTLTWSETGTPIEGPQVFDVYFGVGGIGSTPPLVASDLPTASYTPPPPLTGETTYAWRVVARNAVGETNSILWTFSTRSSTGLIITIEGEEPRIRKAGLTIRDLLTDTPNTCAFTMEGSAPSVGQEVRIGLGTMDPENILFGGYIDTVTSIYEALPANLAWQVTCQDYTYGLNRTKVRTRYAQQSATDIGLDLLARFAPTGYTDAHVAPGLPVVEGGIDFTEKDLTECFARLAQRIGGYWYVDYEKDIHLFLSEEVDAPDPVVPGTRMLMNEPPITSHIDLTQIRTRVFVEGGGGQARANAPAGSTEIPITDAGWYSGSGGIVVSGPQRITYTGAGAQGGPAAPTAGVDVNGFGRPLVGDLVDGPYSYKVTFVISGAETALGAASTPVTIPIPLDPVAALVLSLHSGGPLTGTHRWRVSFRTAHGDTGGNQEAIRVDTGSYALDLDFANILTEAAKDPRYTAMVFYRTNSNHTVYFPVPIAHALGSYNTIPLPWTSGATVALDATPDAGLGPVAMPGNSARGSGKVTVASIPIGPGGTTARKIYRTVAGGTVYKLVGTIANNTATTFSDNIADSALGSGPAGEVATVLSGIPAGGAGAILYDVFSGDEVNILVQCDDLDAQADLADLEGPPSLGIVEHFIQDRRLGLAQATATGNADLALFGRPIITVRYHTRDPKTRSGKLVSILLPEIGLVGDFTIQTVEISEIDAARGLFPRYAVTASSVRFSFEDVLRRLQLET